MDEEVLESIPYARELSPFYQEPVQLTKRRHIFYKPRANQTSERTSQEAEKEVLPWWKKILPNTASVRKAV